MKYSRITFEVTDTKGICKTIAFVGSFEHADLVKFFRIIMNPPVDFLFVRVSTE